MRKLPNAASVIIMAEDCTTPYGRDVKQYLVGTVRQFYGYCVSIGDQRLHEVILSSAPAPLCFDIDIKVEDHCSGLNKLVYRYIVREMERKWCQPVKIADIDIWFFQEEIESSKTHEIPIELLNYSTFHNPAFDRDCLDDYHENDCCQHYIDRYDC